ncbi:hypothetical protein B0J11DRAFT_33550 [Dendryphion nanum]|uniref:Uncharacterized protein n=1 Tax=Dendryphion nanum TaxID=256645 RepID=A0A9P9IYZ7_9PLEO|nr:hypothetical protein B0J11DRAFT_33550 [Dendryphion nanum]
MKMAAWLPSQSLAALLSEAGFVHQCLCFLSRHASVVDLTYGTLRTGWREWGSEAWSGRSTLTLHTWDWRTWSCGVGEKNLATYSGGKVLPDGRCLSELFVTFVTGVIVNLVRSIIPENMARCLRECLGAWK